MKKTIINLILIILLTLITLIIVLSTIGIETSKFNKFILNKVNQTKNINLQLNTIYFKLDPKELSLFLETQNPNLNYRDLSIPVQNIKVYIDFLSILKSNPKINKTSLVFKELNIKELNKLTKIIKPSNFKSILNNKVKEGSLISEIEIFLDEKSLIKNFIAKGTIKGLQVELLNGLKLTKTNLSFFADKSDILIKNIFGNIEDIKISDGDIKLNLDNGVKINSNFSSKIIYDQSLYNKYAKFLKKYEISDNVISLSADLNNNFSINLDNTYKVKNYNYSFSGKIKNSEFELSKPFKNNFIIEEIDKIYLSNFEINSTFNQSNIRIKGIGKYSFNNLEFYKLDLTNIFAKDLINLKSNFEYGNNLELGLINYKKTKKSISNIFLDLEKKKNIFHIIKFNFKESDDLINIEDLKFDRDNFLSFKKIDIKTKNNDFIIQNGKKILIKGSKFDATNLPKYLSDQSGVNKFENFNSNIEIDFKNIKVTLSEKLQNFKLLGEIRKGQFTKITSKGDFGEGNFLDISMKKEENSNKKYLEIYSDLTRPLLTEYVFFNGLTGGKLLFTSIIDEGTSFSKLKIENFKVINAPGVIKLLSLADLGGLADLAAGDGLSFDILEIEMEKKKKFLKINEILALGPSMSVLMEGYQDGSGLTSLRGTLVPAKTLNKVISKIPVIGNIVIPKEVGEGLFGISFKMKGPKGKIKTTLNPIRTLTPRFIQKIIEKKKESN